MADDIRKETEKLSQEIDDASKELKTGFQKIIGGLKETNAPLAKTVANLRKQSKDTFAGALGSAKLRNVSSQIDTFLSDGLDDVAFEKLQSEFGDIDLSEFKKISESAKSLEDGVKELETARDERVANSKVLQKKDKEIAKRREESLNLTGAALEAHMKKTEELESSRQASYDRIAGGYNKEIEQQSRLLDEERSKREEFNAKLEENLNEVASFEKFENFSDAVKDLTGGLIDIGGTFDDVAGKLNSVGQLFGVEDLVGGLSEKLQSGASALYAAVLPFFVGLKAAMIRVITPVITVLKNVAKSMIAPIVTFATASAAFIGGLLATAGSMLVAAAPFIGIGLLVAAAVAAIVIGGKFLYDKFQENKEMIFEKLGDLTERVKSAVLDIKDFFIGSFIKAKAGVGDFGSSLSDMFASFADFVQGAILSVREKLNMVGIGDADEIAAERAQLEENKKQRELAAQQREKEAEERSNLSAIEIARIERKKDEDAKLEAAEKARVEEQLKEKKRLQAEFEADQANLAKVQEDYNNGNASEIDLMKAETFAKQSEMALKGLEKETTGKLTETPQVDAMQRGLKPQPEPKTELSKSKARVKFFEDRVEERKKRIEQKQERWDSMSAEERQSERGQRFAGNIEYSEQKLEKTQNILSKEREKLRNLEGGVQQPTPITPVMQEESSQQIKRSREETDALKEKAVGNIVSSTALNNTNVSSVSNKFTSGRASTSHQDSTVGKLNTVF